MLNTELCKILGIKYPIIQAGMGPFSNNKLCIATANAGVLGLLSTSGITSKQNQPAIYKHFAETGGASPDDAPEVIFQKIYQQTFERTKESGGIFGVNVMVSAELKPTAEMIINTAIKMRKENPEMHERFKVIFTSAGDPVGWGDKIKGAGFKWLHVVPSVKGAERCRKAGVDIIVASGHEGGFHTSWEPVHSMILLPAVVEAMAPHGVPVVGAGGFCDGKTLVAALALGAAGIQMGTRFLATQESDFAKLWKEGIVKAGDRGTLVARGFVGPARWIKTPASLQHQQNTLQKAPGVFLGTPDDGQSKGAQELIDFERAGIDATFAGDESKALYAGGECAQRIDDMPKVKDLVDRIVADARAIIGGFPKRYV
ncbi:MAG: nitronate monooxygenase [Desulfobacterales bacterium]|nr:nitronate monooxygenase [Desulfobacterales bacterium]